MGVALTATARVLQWCRFRERNGVFSEGTCFTAAALPTAGSHLGALGSVCSKESCFMTGDTGHCVLALRGCRPGLF